MRSVLLALGLALQVPTGVVPTGNCRSSSYPLVTRVGSRGSRAEWQRAQE